MSEGRTTIMRMLFDDGAIIYRVANKVVVQLEAPRPQFPEGVEVPMFIAERARLELLPGDIAELVRICLAALDHERERLAQELHQLREGQR